MTSLKTVTGTDAVATGQEESTPAQAGAIAIDEEVTVTVQPAQTDGTVVPAAGGGDANAGAPWLDPVDDEADGKGYVPDAPKDQAKRPSLGSDASRTPSESSSQHSLQDRVGKTSKLHQAEPTRTTGNKIGQGVAALATVAGTGGGAYLGAQIGAAIAGGAFVWSGPGALVAAGVGAAIGAGIGALIGAVGTAYGTTHAVEWASSGAQPHHLDQATRSLERRDGRFTEEEKNNLKELDDKQWRDLLHIPSSKLLGSGQVAGKDNRQAIRQALVECIADGNNLPAAKRYKKELIEDYAESAKIEGRAKAFVGEMGFNTNKRKDLIEELGLLGALPDDIDDKIDRLVANDSSAPDLEQQVGKLLIEEAAGQALESRNLDQQIRVASAIVVQEASHTTDRGAFLQGDYAGKEALGQMLKQQETAFLPQAISTRMQKAVDENDPETGLTLERDTSLLPADVAKAGDIGPDQFSNRGIRAEYNFQQMMGIIFKPDDKHEHFVGVSPAQQQLLRVMAETASRAARANPRDLGQPDDRARDAVRAGFVQSYLVPRLAELAEEEGNTDAAKATLAYDNKLVEHAFGGNVGNTFEARAHAVGDVRGQKQLDAWNQAQLRVKAAVEGWHDRADGFLDLIASDPAQRV
jgi:hypothetical protein